MPGSVPVLELARIVPGNYSQIPILLTTGYSERAQEAVLEDSLFSKSHTICRPCPSAIRTLQWLNLIGSWRDLRRQRMADNGRNKHPQVRNG